MWFTACIISITCLIPIDLLAKKITLKRTVQWIGVACMTYAGMIALNASDFGFKYYRMWGGDLKRRGQYQRAIEAYKEANRHQRHDRPARHSALGDLALKVSDITLAISAYEESARRWHTELRRVGKSLVTNPTDKVLIQDFQRASKKSLKSHSSLQRILSKHSEQQRALDAQVYLEDEQLYIKEIRYLLRSK